MEGDIRVSLNLLLMKRGKQKSKMIENNNNKYNLIFRDHNL